MRKRPSMEGRASGLEAGSGKNRLPVSTPFDSVAQGSSDKLLIAKLHPPVHRAGVRYSARYQVTFRDELIVKASRDPETDLARALLARGITGSVKMVDGATGRHRSTVDIGKAAKLTVREDARRGPCFVRRSAFGGVAIESGDGQSPTTEVDLAHATPPKKSREIGMILRFPRTRPTHSSSNCAAAFCSRCINRRTT